MARGVDQRTGAPTRSSATLLQCSRSDPEQEAAGGRQPRRAQHDGLASQHVPAKRRGAARANVLLLPKTRETVTRPHGSGARSRGRRTPPARRPRIGAVPSATGRARALQRPTTALPPVPHASGLLSLQKLTRADPAPSLSDRPGLLSSLGSSGTGRDERQNGAIVSFAFVAAHGCTHDTTTRGPSRSTYSPAKI